VARPLYSSSSILVDTLDNGIGICIDFASRFLQLTILVGASLQDRLWVDLLAIGEVGRVNCTICMKLGHLDSFLLSVTDGILTSHV
jgi:hypothetical protein